jgi:hypothetical protein
MTFSGITLGIAELLSVVACAASLFYGAFTLAALARQPEQALVVFLGCVLSFFYNAALAVVFSYVRQQKAKDRTAELSREVPAQRPEARR